MEKTYREIFNIYLNKPYVREQLLSELRESILFDVKQALLNRNFNLRAYIEESLRKQKEKEIKEKKLLLKEYERKYLKWITLDGVDYQKLSIVCRPCISDWEKELWTYARIIVSSAPYRGYVGHSRNYLIIDENSNKLLGILGLGSDFIKLPLRDRYIGIHHSETNKIQYLANMYVCVSVYPFSLLTGGKLLALIAPSNIVVNDYMKSIQHKIYGITTTSLYGKSIQYDRLWDPTTILARWKYLGETSGQNTIIHLSPRTRQLINIVAKQIGIKLKTKQSRPTTTKLSKILKFLNLKREDVFPEKLRHKRGVYFCWLIKEEDVFRKDLKDVTYISRELHDIISYWEKRWFERRYSKYKGKLQPYDYSLPKDELQLSKFIQEEIVFDFVDDDIVFDFE